MSILYSYSGRISKVALFSSNHIVYLIPTINKLQIRWTHSVNSDSYRFGEANDLNQGRPHSWETWHRFLLSFCFLEFTDATLANTNYMTYKLCTVTLFICCSYFFQVVLVFPNIDNKTFPYLHWWAVGSPISHLSRLSKHCFTHPALSSHFSLEPQYSFFRFPWKLDDDDFTTDLTFVLSSCLLQLRCVDWSITVMIIIRIARKW